MTEEGPTLAEQEALHDGEPVFGWIWGEGHGSDRDGPLKETGAGLPTVTPEADQ